MCVCVCVRVCGVCVCMCVCVCRVREDICSKLMCTVPNGHNSIHIHSSPFKGCIPIPRLLNNVLGTGLTYTVEPLLEDTPELRPPH